MGPCFDFGREPQAKRAAIFFIMKFLTENSQSGIFPKMLWCRLCWNGLGPRRREMKADEPFAGDAMTAYFG